MIILAVALEALLIYRDALQCLRLILGNPGIKVGDLRAEGVEMPGGHDSSHSPTFFYRSGTWAEGLPFSGESELAPRFSGFS